MNILSRGLLASSTRIPKFADAEKLLATVLSPGADDYRREHEPTVVKSSSRERSYTSNCLLMYAVVGHNTQDRAARNAVTDAS